MSANSNDQVSRIDVSGVSNVHVVYRPITHNVDLVQEFVNLSSESITSTEGFTFFTNTFRRLNHPRAALE
jgi:hypothetical protein